VPDAAAALEGAKWILMERFAEDAELVGELREWLWAHARFRSQVVEGKREEGAKFSDYFDANEPIAGIPSHRALALLRGRREGVLRLSFELPESEPAAPCSWPETRIAARFGLEDRGRPADRFLADVVRWTWKVKLTAHLESELEARLREGAETEAIRVFARNLRDLLLAAAAGPRPTIGLDPGLRTGVKVAVIDLTGRVVETTAIYPHAPRNDWDGSLAILAAMAVRHRIELVAIGNGTASRETDRLVSDLLARYPDLRLQKIVVSEAGASVYSASELAAKEFPNLDVSLRGAVSIARRLQDPLAELVKIDPKSIGVGQYQHDVSQPELARTLDAVVEDCVNAVGADVNTASVPLLSRISGLNARLAANIVSWREQHGPFRSRRQFTDVPRFGEKTFEQAAGFLRVMGAENPLDASAVHPEAYPVVERISRTTGKSVRDLVGNGGFLRTLRPDEFVDDRFGVPTVKDILAELEKPGRDPRPVFRTAAFLEGVREMSDLQPGMRLEGVVTNVANFGAFVDIGVHQDGLVHVSQLADRFVKDPREVVKAGDIVTVTVLEVDVKRRRIGLTLRAQQPPRARAGDRDDSPRPRAHGGARPTAGGAARPAPATAANAGRQDTRRTTDTRAPQTAMGAAFAKVLKE
jgi:uncharacterized protein